MCDISQKTADYCASKFHIPHSTTNPYELIHSPDVDLIFNLTSDEFHAPYTIAALKAGQHVMVEKRFTLGLTTGKSILEAERKAKNGAKVFVVHIRRYAPSFVEAFKGEIATIPRILYARSRDIVGPNSLFVGQSGTEPVKHTDFPPDAVEDRNERIGALLSDVWEGQELTPERNDYCRLLGSLGSHDLSLMREGLGGLSQSVQAVSVNNPFYTAMFNYRNKSGEPYSVTYESGIDQVPRFDAHLAVYGEKKSVSIQYSTPHVKGLPIVVEVDELNEKGERTHSTVQTSLENAYTAELREL